MDPLGKSPIPVPALIAGKTAMLACWIFALAEKLDLITPLYRNPASTIAGMLLLSFGAIIAVASFFFLGRSLSVGLPSGKTELRTGGLYRVSRNPIYAGAFLMCAGSCLITPHPLNYALFVFTVAIHHRIVLREERFLEERFGDEWRAYRQRVRRYAGATRF